MRGEEISIQIPGSIWLYTAVRRVAVSGPQLMLCSAVYLSRLYMVPPPPATLRLNKWAVIDLMGKLWIYFKIDQNQVIDHWFGWGTNLSNDLLLQQSYQQSCWCQPPLMACSLSPLTRVLHKQVRQWQWLGRCPRQSCYCGAHWPELYSTSPNDQYLLIAQIGPFIPAWEQQCHHPANNISDKLSLV